jgi:hypothetical protein
MNKLKEKDLELFLVYGNKTEVYTISLITG